MIIESGEYIIKYYNRKGAFLRDHKDKGNALISSREKAYEFIASDSNEAVSFTIDRRVFNSLDNNLDKG